MLLLVTLVFIFHFSVVIFKRANLLFSYQLVKLGFHVSYIDQQCSSDHLLPVILLPLFIMVHFLGSLIKHVLLS